MTDGKAPICCGTADRHLSMSPSLGNDQAKTTHNPALHMHPGKKGDNPIFQIQYF